MRKKSRLFALAEALRARRTGVTAETLAEQFGVTLRTIYRDLAALQDAGVPIRADRGRGGGYALDKSYQLPPINFSAREAAVLVALANAALVQRTIPFTETLKSASDKVRAALSSSAQRELLDHLRDLQIVGVPTLPCPPAVRRAVETAWFEQRTLRIVYRKTNGHESPRLVRIRNIVCERTQTLLNCDDLDTKAERQFRIDRVISATLM
ncbi:MAG TPA: HTH domain-containing protein [Kofleriaceae bacterium]|nr:HTH domain-containing protein [Kofleriaceae bacterium]